jgi:hypothetical protein
MYLAKSTSNEAPHYVVFSSLLSLPNNLLSNLFLPDAAGGKQREKTKDEKWAQTNIFYERMTTNGTTRTYFN